ncbi:hemicentin-1-like [Nematostella vectensis]|uniref:hemicentin-1-like n=1 Tax=Nematostella vectensis TaxID=45351 RepID=UPI00207738FB|nr:hemicentin-1-like [Nematostella vectensis]
MGSIAFLACALVCLFISSTDASSANWQWQYNTSVCFNDGENATITWRVTLNSGEEVGAVSVSQRKPVVFGSVVEMYSTVTGKGSAFSDRVMMLSYSGLSPVYYVMFTLKVNNSEDEFGTYEIRCNVNSKNYLVGQPPSDTLLKVQVPPSSVIITPPSPTVTERDQVNLTCSADGTPPPTFTWISPQGHTVAHGPSYTIPMVHRDMSGVYTCVATDGCGRNHTMDATLAVRYKPENTKLIPNEHIGCVRDVVSLNCSALANPNNINYTLYRNDTALASNMNGKFVISLNTSGLSIFKCVPSNEVGDGENKIGFFAVKDPPRITSFTSPKIEVEGSGVTMRCIASGTAPLRVAIFHPNGSVLTNTGIYTFSPITRRDGGTYTCTVNNGNECSNDTNTTSITVNYKPENTKLIPNEHIGCVRDVVSLNCSALANPNNINYTLYRNDTALASNMNGTFVISLNASGLSIFKCVPSNEVGDGENKIGFFAVKDPPRITSFTSPKIEVEGSDVTMRCIASGTAPLRVAIFHPNGSVLTNTGIYTFSPITRRDGGTYTCTVNNGNECSNDTNTTSITVNYKPENTKLIPNEHIGCVRDVVSLNCSALANPNNINYTLYRNDTALASNMNGTFVISLNASGLSIFKCVPSNEVGDGENKIGFFAVKDPPRITSFTSPKIEVEGSDVTMRCIASGTAPLRVAIFHPNGSVLTNTGIYTFSPITRRDGGTYTCTVNNGNECSNDTNTTSITVNYKPENTKLIPNEHIGCVRDVVSLNCSALANPNNINYTLYRNDTALASNMNGTFVISLNASGLSIFKCVPSNEVGDGENKIGFFAVKDPPRITSFTSPKIEVEGSGVTMRCIASGTAPLRVAIFHPNGSVLTNTGIYTFSPITRRDGGTYTCTVNNGNECSNDTNTTSITVNYKPENTKLIPNEHIGCVRDVVSLNCSALANPNNINYTLYRNDTALASNMNGTFVISLNASGLSIFKCVPSNEVGDGENKIGFFAVKGIFYRESL